MTRTLQRLKRMMCGLRGHDAVLHFEPHRLSLRCHDCGHETHGWILQPDIHPPDATSIDVCSATGRRGLGRWHSVLELITGAPLTRRPDGSGHATA